MIKPIFTQKCKHYNAFGRTGLSSKFTKLSELKPFSELTFVVVTVANRTTGYISVTYHIQQSRTMSWTYLTSILYSLNYYQECVTELTLANKINKLPINAESPLDSKTYLTLNQIVIR